MIATIRDLTAAVRGLRPDADHAGILITEDHVRATRDILGWSRYEDVDAEQLDAIADLSVNLALASSAAALLGRRGGLAGRGEAKRRDVDYSELGRKGGAAGKGKRKPRA